MNRCRKLAQCLFFNDELSDMPAASSAMKRRYCLEEFTRCARYTVKIVLGDEFVPHDMFPDDATRAKIILSDKI
jgi:hypothetical protein